ncbi:MAG: UvrD-helicase domain-containing protein [Myxococcaceae bacterium]
MRFLTYEGLHAAGLEPQLARVQEAFERDDLAAIDLKKLQGGYYRAKLNDSARLVLQFVTSQGARAVLALEVLPHHEYERSRFLRGARVDEARIEAAVEPLEARPIKYLHPSRPRFALLDKPISFDDTQDEILRRRPPLVVVGSAGSGKTALLLQHLRAAPGRVAYVTESSWLAQTARGLYVALDYDPGEQEADFLSYRQFLDSLEVPTGQAVGFRDFTAFFERHRQKVPFTDAHRCFEEFRGVLTADADGALGLDAYLALGVRQSLFDEAQRRALFEIFLRYQAWLKEQGRFEPNVIAHQWLAKATPRYDFIAIDEVQDLTPVQLQLVLRCLSTPGAFVLAGDANQVVHPNFFSWAKVKTLFWRGLSSASEVAVLRVSYRNSPEVTRVANAVLAIKHAKFGSIDKESNALLEAVPGEAGEVRGLSTRSPELAALDERTRRSTEVAVVVLRDEDKADARRHFRTPLVFTILEAKGLEYENVILFRVVSSERRLFSSLAEGLTPADVDVTALDYGRARDKGDKSSEAYKFFVNALYVALTRAVKNVWLVEDDEAHPLLQLLRVPFDGRPVAGSVKQASTEDWQREASRLEAHGKLEQVEAIRSQVLRISATPWKPLDGAGMIELLGRALDPQGVSRKAREQLLDVLVMHPDQFSASELSQLGFRSFKEQATQRDAMHARLVQEFASKKHKLVLENTERYGLEYVSLQGLTPLMLAAEAGNVPLIEALLSRGANRSARDMYGLQALHHVLRKAWRDEAFARSELGAAWELLAPPSFDVQVDGHLVQIGREQGEYIVFQLMLERLWLSEATVKLQLLGIGTTELMSYVERLPEVVMRDYRRKRPYLSSMLSKNEASGGKGRRLFERRGHGLYWFNPALSVWSARAGGDGVWEPIDSVLGLALRQEPLKFAAQRQW